MKLCEDCATEEEKEKRREIEEKKEELDEGSSFESLDIGSVPEIGLEEGQVCIRCGEVNSTGRTEDKVLAKGTKGKVVQWDGSPVRPLERAWRKQAKGKSAMWMYLGPLKITGEFPDDKVEIRENTKFYDQKRETDLVARNISVDRESGMTYVEFEVKNTFEPRKKLVFSIDDIKERLESGQFKSMKRVNREAEEALEELRENA